MSKVSEAYLTLSLGFKQLAEAIVAEGGEAPAAPSVPAKAAGKTAAAPAKVVKTPAKAKPVTADEVRALVDKAIEDFSPDEIRPLVQKYAKKFKDVVEEDLPKLKADIEALYASKAEDAGVPEAADEDSDI